VARALILFLIACTPAPVVPRSAPDALELVESAPAGTTLDHADIPNAFDVWPKMFDGAKKLIDVEEFYASSNPAGGDKLEASIVAIEHALARGVVVRVLLDDTFHTKYPEVPARLERAGAKVKATKRFDANGGVLHAKFFVVDREDAYLGSQNFDYRSLEHIQELGARVHSVPIAEALEAVFESDWTDGIVPVKACTATLDFLGQPVRATPIFSPKDALPDPNAWDLPRLVAAIDGAKKDLRVQVLTYDAKAHDGSAFPDLDDALRRAAARNVRVRLLVSEWTRKHETALGPLSHVANVEVKVATIPQPPGPEIPFARIIHAKYMVCDDALAWVGTSNWEGDYFTKIRNVGLILEGTSTATVLAKFFDDGFGSTYAAPY
jgi:phosphatidylserine/phosphatidylglycerophosphate/cardiolipin synthase-like enzyme